MLTMQDAVRQIRDLQRRTDELIEECNADHLALLRARQQAAEWKRSAQEWKERAEAMRASLPDPDDEANDFFADDAVHGG